MRRISFVMIVALIVGALMISCNSEVGTNSGSDSLAKVSVSLGSDSKAITATPSSSITPVEQLHWYYVATKTDTGLYATGATEWSPVPTTGGTASEGQMVEGRLLNLFSTGSWSFSFYGYKTAQDSKPGTPKDTAVYYAEGIPKTVTEDTSVNVELHTGALDRAKVKFDSVQFKTTGLNINPTASGNFTLQISGLGETPITSDSVAYASNTSEYTFKFNSQTSKTVENLAAGNYIVTFQVLFGDVVVAEEEKNITVSAGTIVTFSGDVLSTDPTHTVVIGNVTSTTTATATVNANPVNAITIQNSITPVSSTATSTANVTTVSFPAESLATQSSTETAVVLEMTVYDTAAAAAKFTVNSSSASAALDLVLTVGEEQVETFNKYVAVSTYIATGLQDVTVRTSGEAVVFKSDNTNPDASACLSDESTTGTGYNPSTGLLVFKTNHFSSFYVNSSNEAVNITTNVAYEKLVGAVDAASANDTIMLLKDVNITYDSTKRYDILIDKSLVLEGNGYSIVSNRPLGEGGNNASSIIAVQNGVGSSVVVPYIDVRINNLTINTSTCNSVVFVPFESQFINLTINHCDLRTNNTKYPINVRASQYINVSIIGNSFIKGYCALNFYGSLSNLSISNSTLYGYNGASTHTSNSYSVIVLDGGAYWGVAQGLAAQNNIIVITDSVLIAESANNPEAWISFQYGSAGNAASVTIAGTQFKTTNDSNSEDAVTKIWFQNANTGDSVTLPLDATQLSSMQSAYANDTNDCYFHIEDLGNGLYRLTRTE